MVLLRCNLLRASFLHLIKDTDSMTFCRDMQLRFFKVKALLNNACIIIVILHNNKNSYYNNINGGVVCSLLPCQNFHTNNSAVIDSTRARQDRTIHSFHNEHSELCSS